MGRSPHHRPTVLDRLNRGSREERRHSLPRQDPIQVPCRYVNCRNPDCRFLHSSRDRMKRPRSRSRSPVRRSRSPRSESRSLRRRVVRSRSRSPDRQQTSSVAPLVISLNRDSSPSSNRSHQSSMLDATIRITRAAESIIPDQDSATLDYVATSAASAPSTASASPPSHPTPLDLLSPPPRSPGPYTAHIPNTFETSLPMTPPESPPDTHPAPSPEVEQPTTPPESIDAESSPRPLRAAATATAGRPPSMPTAPETVPMDMATSPPPPTSHDVSTAVSPGAFSALTPAMPVPSTLALGAGLLSASRVVAKRYVAIPEQPITIAARVIFRHDADGQIMELTYEFGVEYSRTSDTHSAVLCRVKALLMVEGHVDMWWTSLSGFTLSTAFHQSEWDPSTPFIVNIDSAHNVFASDPATLRARAALTRWIDTPNTAGQPGLAFKLLIFPLLQLSEQSSSEASRSGRVLGWSLDYKEEEKQSVAKFVADPAALSEHQRLIVDLATQATDDCLLRLLVMRREVPSDGVRLPCDLCEGLLQEAASALLEEGIMTPDAHMPTAKKVIELATRNQVKLAWIVAFKRQEAKSSTVRRRICWDPALWSPRRLFRRYPTGWASEALAATQSLCVKALVTFGGMGENTAKLLVTSASTPPKPLTSAHLKPAEPTTAPIRMTDTTDTLPTANAPIAAAALPEPSPVKAEAGTSIKVEDASVEPVPPEGSNQDVRHSAATALSKLGRITHIHRNFAVVDRTIKVRARSHRPWNERHHWFAELQVGDYVEYTLKNDDKGCKEITWCADPTTHVYRGQAWGHSDHTLLQDQVTPHELLTNLQDPTFKPEALLGKFVLFCPKPGSRAEVCQIVDVRDCLAEYDFQHVQTKLWIGVRWPRCRGKLIPLTRLSIGVFTEDEMARWRQG